MAWTSAAKNDEAALVGEWPRTYRPGGATRWLLNGLGAVFASGGLALLAWASFGAAGADRRPLTIAAIVSVVFGGAALLALRGARVVLWEGAIEFMGFGRRRRFQKGEIVGWRAIPLQYGQRQLVLEFRMARKPFKTSWFWREDEAFTAWLEALPNLDAEERARLEAELLQSKELGPSEAERTASLRTARLVARVTTGASVAAAAWAFFRPEPYALAIGVLAAIPVLVGLVLMLGRGVYSLEGERNDPRPNLAFALIAPGLVLMLRSLGDLSVIDWQRPLVWTLAAAPAAAFVLRAGDPRARRRWFVVPLFALMCAPWAWGSLTLGNAVLDGSPGEPFRAQVVDKRISSGKHTSHYLKLAPWGPVTEEDEVDVGRAAYDRIEIGDVVCPRLRPGALGFRWFRLEGCEGS